MDCLGDVLELDFVQYHFFSQICARVIPINSGSIWNASFVVVDMFHVPQPVRNAHTSMDSRNGTAFRGVSSEQDGRYQTKVLKEIKAVGFPKELDIKIDFQKVKMNMMKPWISKRVAELLGIDDEVLFQYIIELLSAKKVSPKEMIINLQGFLDENAKIFVVELWKLLISAQNNASGIPQEFLDAEKLELEKEREERRKIESELIKRQDEQKRIAQDRNRLENRIFDRDFKSAKEEPKKTSTRRRSRTPPRRRNYDSSSPSP